MKQTLLISFLISIGIFAYGQDYWTSFNGPYGGTVNDIVRHSSGAIVAATNNGIWRSTDDGASWSSVSTGTDVIFYDLDLDVSENIFAMASFKLYKSTDGGATFVNLASTGIPSGMRKIKVAPAGNIFLTDMSTNLYRSSTAGVSFTISFTFGSTINDIDTDANSIIYVSTSNSGLQRSGNPSGTTGFNAGIGSLTTSSTIYSSDVSTSGVVFSLANDGIHRSSDGGANFSSINGSIAEPSYRGELVWNGGTLFLLNNDTKKYFSTANPTDSPPTWTAGTDYPIALDAENLLIQSGSIQYLAFQGYGISKTTNSGTTWNSAVSGLKAFDKNPTTYITLNNRILMGWEGIGYYLSIDNGNTFDLIASNAGNTNRQINGFITLDDGSILGYGGGAVRSADMGSTWNSQNTTNFLSSVVTTDSINLFSYDGNLLSSNDRGVTWNSQPIAALPFADKIQADNSNNIYFRASNNLYRVNSGETTASLLPVGNLITDFVVVNDAIFAINGSNFYHSNDGGTNWTTKTIPNSNRIWAYNDQLDQSIFIHNNSTSAFNISIDNGVTWKSQQLPDIKAKINDLLITSNNFGYVSANNSVGYRTNNNIVIPPAPTNLAVVGRSFNAVELLWQDNSSVETTWEIQRSIGNNTSFETLGTASSFDILPNTFNFRVFGDPGVTYFYRVRATNSGGESNFSNEASETLLDKCSSTLPDNRSWDATTVLDVGTPTGTPPFANPNAVVKLTIGATNTFSIDDYRLGVEGGSAVLATFDEACTETFFVGGGSDHANGNGMWDDVTKTLTLKWKSRGDNPSLAGTTTLVLNSTDPIPETPGIAVYSVSATEAMISWNQTAFEEEYIIERTTTSGSNYTELPAIQYPSVFFIDTNLTSGQTYYYKIRAQNVTGSSAFSAETSVTLVNGLFRPVDNILQQNFDKQGAGSWGDMDGDGWEDLIIARTSSNGLPVPPIFYKNLGATQPGQFEQKNLSVLDNENISSNGINLFDFNNDGMLDVYIARGGANVSDLILINADNNWNFSKMIIPNTGAYVNTVGRGAVAFDYDNDGFVDVFSGQRQSNTAGPHPRDLLFKNIGGTNFSEIISGPVVTELTSSLTSNAVDYDNDGDQDLFVINFSSSLPAGNLFNNNGDGTFTKVVGTIFQTENLLLPATSSWGDIDNDGDLDVYVGQFINIPGLTDRMYRNNGDGTFTNLAGNGAAENNTSTFGSSFGDIDNDGDIDLVVANGKIIPSASSTSNSIFLNDGSGNFTRYNGIEIITHPSVSNLGISMADFDNDGFLDLYAGKGINTTVDLPNFLYKNTLTPSASRHWLQIKLIGTQSNRAAIGARVKVVTSSPARSQIREISTRTGFGGINSLLAHFGLGTATAIDQIEIKWPSGNIQTLNNIATIDQTLIIEEDVLGPTFTFNPPTNTTTAPIGTTIDVILDESATPVTGKFITIKKASVGSTPLQSINVTDGTQNGNTYTYTLAASTEYSTEYFISIDAGAFVDQYQNLSLAVSATDWTFTTEEAPDLTFPLITFDPNDYISLTKAEVQGSQEKLVAVATDNKGIASFIMHYRKVTATQISQVFGTLTTAPSYEFPLLSSFFDEMGLEFYLEAKDAAGNTTLSPPSGFHRIKLSFDDTNNNISISSGTTASGYQIWSVPFENLPSNQISVLFDELGAPDGTQYRILKYQHPDAWIEYPNGVSSVQRGEGYFIISRNATTVNFGSADSPSNSQDNLFAVNLIAGWNLIGNPYTVTASWNESIAGLTGVGGLKVYQSGAYADGNEMAIFSGGFVFADAPQIVPIKLKTSATGGRTNKNDFTSELDQSKWMIPFELEQAGSNFLLGGIGMHPDSKQSYDDYDDLNPPAIDERLEIKFKHPEHFMKAFSRDMVPTQGGFEWEFNVLSDKDGLATLSWDPSLFGDNTKELVLYDLGLQRLIDMRTVSSHIFNPSVSTDFKLYFGENLEQKIRPSGVTLGYPSPNPTKQISTISFTLSDKEPDYQVNLEVYDMMGRRIENLLNNTLPAGFYSYQWDTAKEDIATGLYTYRLAVSANGKRDIQTRKVIVNK